MFFFILFLSVLSLGLSSSCPHLLFFHFEAQEESLFLSYSNNIGQVWLSMNNGKSILNTSKGVPGLRDPFVNRAVDGSGYFMVATNGQNFGGVNNILTFSTKDFTSWTQNLVAFQPENGTVVDTWAPEFVFDVTTDSYLVFSAIQGVNNTSPAYESECVNSNDSRFRFWYSHTSDFITFDHPLQLLFDPGCGDATNGMGGIDGDIQVNDNGQFVLVYKDARGKSEDVRGIRLVVSDFLAGPYGPISPLLAPVHVEAPQLVQTSSIAKGDTKNEWLLYYDCSFFPTPAGFPRPPYGVSRTSTLSNYSFTQLPGACTGDSSLTSFPLGATHGSFLCLNTSELLQVLTALGP